MWKKFAHSYDNECSRYTLLDNTSRVNSNLNRGIFGNLMFSIFRPMNSQQSSIIYMMFKSVLDTKQRKKSVFENNWLIVHYRVFLETALTVLNVHYFIL